MNKKHVGSSFKSFLLEMGDDMVDPHSASREHYVNCPCAMDTSIPENECTCQSDLDSDWDHGQEEIEIMMTHDETCPKRYDLADECACGQDPNDFPEVEINSHLGESSQRLDFDKFMDSIVISEAKAVKSDSDETPQRKHAKMYRERYQNSIRFGRSK